MGWGWNQCTWSEESVNVATLGQHVLTQPRSGLLGLYIVGRRGCLATFEESADARAVIVSLGLQIRLMPHVGLDIHKRLSS